MTVTDVNAIENYRFLPLDEAVSPTRGAYFQRYAGFWWAVHPDRGLAFWNPKRHNGKRRAPGLGSPQCNPSEAISRSVAAKTITTWPAEVRLIEVVWIPISLSEFRD